LEGLKVLALAWAVHCRKIHWKLYAVLQGEPAIKLFLGFDIISPFLKANNGY
jgi:hypothetical protein